MGPPVNGLFAHRRDERGSCAGRACWLWNGGSAQACVCTCDAARQDVGTTATERERARRDVERLYVEARPAVENFNAPWKLLATARARTAAQQMSSRGATLRSAR